MVPLFDTSISHCSSMWAGSKLGAGILDVPYSDDGCLVTDVNPPLEACCPDKEFRLPLFPTGDGVLLNKEQLALLLFTEVAAHKESLLC